MSAPSTRAILALGGVVVLVGLVAWLLLRDDDSAPAVSGAPTLASASELEDLAAEVDHPVYWAGARSGSSYELTKTADGRIYVRYLPSGVEAGDPSPKFTTIATYPQPKAYAATVAASHRPGAKAYNTRSGALVVTNDASPTSVYFAFKGEPYLVEVFDPSAKKALDLALSGAIVRLASKS